MPRPIITLITDFGLRDAYVGAVKGVILSLNPEAILVDITHEIGPQGIEEAARILPDISAYFPSGTVHLAVVDPGVGGDRKELVVCAGKQFFVGPDNGIFSILIGSGRFFRAFRIEDPRFRLPAPGQTFQGRDVFAPAAAFLSLGVDPRELGRPVRKLARIPCPRTREVGGELRGRVIRADRFGNLITNVSRQELDRFGGPDLEVWAGKLRIGKIRPSYEGAESGQVLATIGGFGWLEIAVNRGRADQVLGLGAGTGIRVRKGNIRKRPRV